MEGDAGSQWYVQLGLAFCSGGCGQCSDHVPETWQPRTPRWVCQLHFDHIALKCPVFPLFHYMEDDLNMKCQLRRLDCLDCSKVVASSGPLGYSPGFLVGHSAVGYCRCKN